MTADINQLLDWKPDEGLASLETISADAHRSGMRHFAQGVSIITTAHDDVRGGLTATAVCSVTAEPPRLVVFVNKSASAHKLILNSGLLCVNILSAEQEQTAKVFAGMTKSLEGDARFKVGDWDTLITGAPVLRNALANFDCRVIKVFDESSHNAFLCEILATKEGQCNKSLIYVQGQFRKLAQTVA